MPSPSSGERPALNSGPHTGPVTEAPLGLAIGAEEPLDALHAPRPRRRAWPALLALLVLAGLGVGGWRWWTTRGRLRVPKDTRATYVVERADLPIVIRDNGSLDALRSEIIKSKVEGQATIISIVKEGTIITEEDVKAGKLLVELDSSDIREKLTQQEVTFATAEAAYKQAKESYDIEKSSGESKVKEGELNVKFSKMDLEAFVGQSLATEALEGRADLIKLALQLHGQAVAHRKEVEAEVARSLAGIEQALKQPPKTDGAAGSPAESHAPADTPSTAAAAPRAAAQPAVETPASLGTLTHRLEGSALQKTRKLEADIGLAYEEFKRAADKVVSYASLKQLGIKSAQQLEAEQLALMRARIALDQALTARELFLRYEMPKAAEELLSLFQEKVKELERIRARARSALAAAEAEMKSTEAKYLLQKDRLAKLTSQLEYCAIRAPRPGLVVYATSGGEWRWRSSPIDVGATVHERQDIIKMPDLSTLALKVRIHESVVDKVKPDQPATIRIDAFPNRSYKGKVLRVAVLPNTSSSWLNPDLKEYDTEISIEGDLTGLKPGMSGDVEIHVKTLKGVIQVPVQAVAPHNGKTVVHVLRPDGSEEIREVTIGESNDQVAEVQSGLSEGERVLLEAPQAAPALEEEDAKKKQEEEEELNGAVPPPPPPVVSPTGQPGAPRGDGEGRPGGERPRSGGLRGQRGFGPRSGPGRGGP